MVGGNAERDALACAFAAGRSKGPMLQRVVLQRVVQSGPQTAEHRRSAAAEA